VRRLYHHGDYRGFDSSPNASYRMQQTITSQNTDGLTTTGRSELYASDALDGDNLILPSDDDGILDDCHLLHKRTHATAFVKTAHNNTAPGSKIYQFSFQASGQDPLVPVPDGLTPNIDWKVDVQIDATTTPPRWKITGSHDCYPAYEVYVNGEMIYGFMPGGVQPLDETNSIFLLWNCLGINPAVKFDCSGALGTNQPCLRTTN